MHGILRRALGYKQGQNETELNYCGNVTEPNTEAVTDGCGKFRNEELLRFPVRQMP
jgi:hypothetical protein